jgi:hypothetical protein
MSVVDQYRELPRAGKWGVWALAGLAFYFLVVEVAVERWSTWTTQAAVKEAQLREWSGSSEARKADESTVMNGTRLFGQVAFPGPEAERSQALRSRIAEVLKKHGVREYEERGREFLLERGPLNAAVGTGSRVRRIVRDVTFEATPDTMTLILADLERAPEVSTISNVSARKTTASGNRGGSSRNLSIRIAVETWGLAREAAPVQPAGGGV